MAERGTEIAEAHSTATDRAQLHPLDRQQNDMAVQLLHQLAIECPVSPQPHPSYDPVTLVAGYEAVTEVLQRRKDFSNRCGHSFKSEPGETFDALAIFTQEGDAHRRVRRIVATTLSPALVTQAESHIRAVCNEAAAAIPELGHAELRRDWASKIPGRVVTHLIGVPDSEHEQFLVWATQRMAGLTRLALGEIDLAEMREVEAPFAAYISAQLALRRSGTLSGDDILSRFLVTADEEGDLLSDEEIISNAIFLLTAGNGTTVNLLLSMVYQLIGTGQWGRVSADRSLVPACVEEALRLNPPIQYMLRRPTFDTEVAGCPVAANDVLALSNIGADIDPTVWGPDAREFRLDRSTTTKHLGFGMGSHSCPGSAVARRVADVALNALLDRFNDLSLTSDFEWQEVDYFTSFGPRELTVQW
jgi:cytochrome P450